MNWIRDSLLTAFGPLPGRRHQAQAHRQASAAGFHPWLTLGLARWLRFASAHTVATPGGVRVAVGGPAVPTIGLMIFVTGTAGIIGMHIARRLLKREAQVLWLDNLDNKYDPQLKLARLEKLAQHKNLTFCVADTADARTVYGDGRNSDMLPRLWRLRLLILA